MHGSAAGDERVAGVTLPLLFLSAYVTPELNIKLPRCFSSREAVRLRLTILQNGVYALCQEAAEKICQNGFARGYPAGFFLFTSVCRGHKKTAVVNGGLQFQSEYALGVLTLHFTVDKQHNDCANHRHNKAAEVKTVNLAKAE